MVNLAIRRPKKITYVGITAQMWLKSKILTYLVARYKHSIIKVYFPHLGSCEYSTTKRKVLSSINLVSPYC